jgi:hypothetical protein
MADVQKILETALQQLIAAGLEQKGMSKGEAQILSKAIIGLDKVDQVLVAADDEAERILTPEKKKAKRKLNSWQRYVKSNSKKFKYKSGKKKGQVNFKSMSRAFKKTPAGKTGRRRKK